MSASITATWRKRPNRAGFQVTVRPHNQNPWTRTVKTRAEAVHLTRHFNRLGLEGIEVAVPAPRAPAPQYPKLQDALPSFIDQQVRLGELRESTACNYRDRLRVWAYPFKGSHCPESLGDTRIDRVTREQLGALIHHIRSAGKSLAVVEQVRGPISRYYQWLINTQGFKGTNPAADLRYFVGRQAKKAKERDVRPFSHNEARTLFAAAETLLPRWATFLKIGLLAGLRWGEIVALERSDLDFARGRVHVQRTFSEKGNRIERCKDGDARWVVLTPHLMSALRAQCEAVALEGEVKTWSAESRQLVFPNTRGRMTHYGQFLSNVWQALLARTTLPYRKPHALRHTFAVWHLERGADPRWVQQQMGHASIQETVDTYGSWIAERHDQNAAEMDRLLGQ